jgi:hypothetical protein
MLSLAHLRAELRPILPSVVALTVLVCLPVAAGRTSDSTGNRLGNPIALNEKRLFALGMIESGNDDRGVGSAGEVSRYQIHPVVWKAYSNSKDYHHHEVSLHVAREHWNYLTNYFRERTGREATDLDMYVLWNTRFGYYASKRFEPRQLHRTVRNRAQRFVNLVNR